MSRFNAFQKKFEAYEAKRFSAAKKAGSLMHGNSDMTRSCQYINMFSNEVGTIISR